MTPEEFKRSTQAAYLKAIRNATLWMSPPSGVQRLLDVPVFGREGGYDFVNTNISHLYEAVLEHAEAKQSYMSMQTHWFGSAAREGMVEALKELTLMEVKSSDAAVIITWAKSHTDLV